MATLLPLRAKAEGFPASWIGYLGSAYFAGMLVGAMLATRLLRRIGHVRTLLICVVVSAATAIAFGLYIQIWFWAFLRFLFGFAFALLFASMESWLNDKASDAYRGRVLGIYSVVQFVGWGLGTQLIALGDPSTLWLFGVATIALGFAAFPLLAGARDTPAPPTTTELRLWALWRQSPIAVVGTFLVGIANGGFWSLNPVYGAEIGLSVAAIATYVTMTQIGAGLFQIPIGKLSDMGDRRYVLVGLTISAAVLQFGLATMPPLSPLALLMAASVVLGGLLSTPYYVISAHTNDRTEAGEKVRISAALLLLYCIGAVFGPTTCALVMEWLGPGGLFVHTGIAHALIAAFTLYRIARRPPPAQRATPGVARPG
jgi:MFS family permease